jgi:Ca2+-binding RTX toxin-like protein
MRRLVLIVGVLAGMAFGAAPAAAGTASRGSGCGPGCTEWPTPYTYRAAPGELNDTTVRLDGDDVVFTDRLGVPLVAGEGCRQGVGELRCAIDHSRRIYVITDDLADRITVGDEVDDRMMVHAVSGGGPDEIVPGGSSWNEGGPGDDVYRNGPDDACCVDDSVEYSDHTVGVTVRLGSATPSVGNGAPGESDTIEDGLETVSGSWHDDTIIGDDDVNDLYGSFGDDTLSGGGANDWLWGSFGRQTLDGGAGPDRMWPSEQPVDVRGGEGRDTALFDNYFPAPPLFVSLDDLANDGSDRDGDLLPDTLGNVHSDVEDVRGTEAGDRLIGSDAANFVEGDLGADWIVGRGGEDTLAAGDGDDVVVALDLEADDVSCGAGHDVAVVDPGDHASGCEVLLGSLDDLPPLFEPLGLVAEGRGAAWLRRQVDSGFSDWLSFHAPDGVASDLTVTATRLGARLTVRIADAAAPVVPGPGCREDGDAVLCEADASVLGLALGDGDDRLTVTGDAPVRVDCGGGADVATLPPGTEATSCENGAPEIEEPEVPVGEEPIAPEEPTEPVVPATTWSSAGVETQGAGGTPAATVPISAPTPGETGEGSPAAPRGPLAAPDAVVTRGRRVVVVLRCERAAGTCRGALRLVAGRRTLARGRYAVPAGGEQPVALRATRAGRKLLAGTRRAALVDAAAGRRWRVALTRAAR